MTELLNLIVDSSELSQNAFLGVSVSNDLQINKVEIDFDLQEKNIEIIKSLNGFVINLASPEAFSIYRAYLLQAINANKNIRPFIFDTSSIKYQVAKWSYISPSANIGAGTKVGLLSYIGPNTTIGPNSSIGNYCWIDEGVTVGSGVEISSHVTIHSGAHIGSGSIVGRFNEIRRDKPPNSILKHKIIELDFYDSSAEIYGV